MQTVYRSSKHSM